MTNDTKGDAVERNQPLGGSASSPQTFTLKEHQVDIIRRMDDGPLGIFAEAGTGKTMIALTWLRDAIMDGRIEDALVICPSSLVRNWQNNIDKMPMFDGFSDIDAEAVREAVTVCSFRMTWTAKKGRSVILRDIVDKSWGAVIIDESHRLGAHNSLQTKACLTLAKMAEHRYVMTGTPDSTKYTKLYGQIKFLDPVLWPRHRDFYRHAVVEEDFFHNPKTYDVDWCESLKREYGAVVRLRDCFDMPDTTEEDIIVDNLAKGTYKDILDGKYEKHNITLMGAGTEYGKLLQICSGHLKTDTEVKDLKTQKLDALLEVVEGTEDKVVIFARYRRSIERICETLDKASISHHRFDGTVQEPVWQDFQTDASKAIVVQYQRGGVGIDLYASHTCIFYEPTFSVVDLDQAKARIMRIGQVNRCIYYYLTTTGTIEERAWRSVRSGVDVSTALLDEWAEEEKAS